VSRYRLIKLSLWPNVPRPIARWNPEAPQDQLYSMYSILITS
jgi:hypothetical protein